METIDLSMMTHPDAFSYAVEFQLPRFRWHNLVTILKYGNEGLTEFHTRATITLTKAAGNGV